MRPVPHSAPLVRLLLALFAMVLASAATMARAELPARPTGPILDAASIIPDAQEAALDRKLRDYNMRTGRALIVATVTSLDERPVEEYAQELAETWDIGGKETEMGVLLLIAPNERKLRIHAARGVQERLPDVIAKRIIRDQITPRFKAGDFAGGIAAGVDGITAQLDRDPADTKAIAEAEKAAAAQQNSDRSGSDGTSLVFWLILMIVLISFFNRGRRGYRRSGIDPGIILWGISEAMHHGRGSGGSDWGGGSSSGGGDFGGFGGFGGGGGGFDGGGASGDW